MLLTVKAIGGKGSGINFSCESHIKVLITGVSALFTECQIPPRLENMTVSISGPPYFSTVKFDEI